MFEEFAGKGSKVRFLNKNGSSFDLANARKYFTENEELIVEGIEIGDWCSNYKLKGSNHSFNTVMFEVIDQKPVTVEGWYIENNKLRGLFGGRFLKTTEVLVLSEEEGIVKTANSVYHLGTKHEV